MKTNAENLIKYKEGGLYCEIADIWIDPKKAVKTALITHAHFDHFSCGCEDYISTLETAEIIKARLGKSINIKTYDYGIIRTHQS